MKLFKRIGFVILFATASTQAFAAVIPSGIQSDLTLAQIQGWGWTECSRSDAGSETSTSGVINACNSGTHLMMALWDSSKGLFGIAGAGEFDVVTAITYDNYYSSGFGGFSDDDATSLNNWSNGLNWYRTAGHGSWGFTTISSVALSSADINLLNGLNDYSSAGNSISELDLGELAKGLSFHTHSNNGGGLSWGWAYNVTGNDYTYFGAGDSRVFFTATVAEVPEPSTLGLLGLALLAVRRLRRS